MRKSYKFGLNAKEVNGIISGDFQVYMNEAGDVQNQNPYGQCYFDDRQQMALTQNNTKVTSIPSPYARMHITDIAFREIMAGVGVMNASDIEAHINSMSGDYLRAMSHCLDMYEMMFHFKELDLIDKGISIKLIDLVSKRDGRYAELLAGNKNLSSYIDTLDLFRQRYIADIRSRRVDAYQFDFTQMYIFKYKGRTFAATSPFTGFFAKADCNLSEANLSVSWIADDGRHSHKLFTDTPKEWLGVKDRDPKLLKFLYLLLKDNLGAIFSNLFRAVECCIPDVQALANVTFEESYPEFNLGNNVLPQIAGNTQNVSCIRPDGLDCSYLKYLLYLCKPIDLAISKEAYSLDINDRVFPEGSENKVPWIGVNDFLSDALVVLPYDINENYYAATYIDENNNPHRRCLLPLKRRALDYLDITGITDENLLVKKYPDKHYAVTLKLPLTIGGEVELRRDYYDVDKVECAFPNGVLKDLQDDGRHFAFGIYPFVRSTLYENIYKVLFYNDFKWPDGFRPQPNDKLYDLAFYYFDDQHHAVAYANETNVVANQTNKADSDLNVNTHYYQVKNPTRVNGHYVAIDFAEISLTLIKDPNSGNPQRVNATAIIAPKYHPVAFNDGSTTIAVDLGTSNTYIAYQHASEQALELPREISTIHDGWNELTLMNKECSRADRSDAYDINRQDLYLRTSDRIVPDDVCLPSQLCEFIPTKIRQSTDSQILGYNFPIPSVINNLRINCENRGTFEGDRIPLVHSSIPFAYYTIGSRPNTEANRYDTMSGGEFKWFYTKDKYGNFNLNSTKRADFRSFLHELMFIVRSHMLCQGYELEKCTLIWTYPLAFQKELLDFYKVEWDRAYCKYFNPELLNANDQINDEVAIETRVKYTNESRSPIYECMDNPGAANLLTILMDIGGGSTDVIGYFQNQPQFVTSFGFAGNALYLGGSMNHSERELSQNYIRQYVRTSCESVFRQDSLMNGTKKIGKDAPINTLMNYGFSESPLEFRAIFNNESVKFMLQFHNAAIFYHTAQLCKIVKGDEVPDTVYLTGNGSNLIKLGGDENLISRIFSKVYEKECCIKVSFPRYPKGATALGALKGNNAGLKFNEDSSSAQVKLLGDASTKFDVNPQDPRFNLEDPGISMQKVRKNVMDFVSAFFCSCRMTPYLSEDDVLGCMRYVDNDQMLCFDQYLSNSMFFQYISLLMEQMSILIVDRQQRR